MKFFQKKKKYTFKDACSLINSFSVEFYKDLDLRI